MSPTRHWIEPREPIQPEVALEDVLAYLTKQTHPLSIREIAHGMDLRHRGRLPGAADGDLSALKVSLGGSVPEELAQLLHWHAGQSADVPGALEQSWNLMSPGEIVSSKKELDAQPPHGWHKGVTVYLLK